MKSELGNFPADSETGTPCIDIKRLELNLLNSNVLMSISHSLCKESRENRNHNIITGTSMERFGNSFHDDIQKLMDMSKNKNTTKAIPKVIAFLVFFNLGSSIFS